MHNRAHFLPESPACILIAVRHNARAPPPASSRLVPAMQKKYQVFISSTYTDLVQERQIILRSILDLGHIPSGMELFSAADEEQVAYIKKIIDECDYYVLVIGGRYGS
jgi:hypothetical protein